MRGFLDGARGRKVKSVGGVYGGGKSGTRCWSRLTGQTVCTVFFGHVRVGMGWRGGGGGGCESRDRALWYKQQQQQKNRDISYITLLPLINTLHSHPETNKKPSPEQNKANRTNQPTNQPQTQPTNQPTNVLPH